MTEVFFLGEDQYCLIKMNKMSEMAPGHVFNAVLAERAKSASCSKMKVSTRVVLEGYDRGV